LLYIRKMALVDKYLNEKEKDPRKPVSSIAKDLSASKSTLDRYKSGVNLTSNRKVHRYTRERRREITMKAMRTRRLNEMYKDEMEDVQSRELSKEEFDREIEKLDNRYGKSTSKSHSTATSDSPRVNPKKMKGGAFDPTIMDLVEQTGEAVTEKENIKGGTLTPFQFGKIPTKHKPDMASSMESSSLAKNIVQSLHGSRKQPEITDDLFKNMMAESFERP
jgi:hypothetical protein